MDTILETVAMKNLFGCNDRLEIKDDYGANHTIWWNKWVSNQATNMQTNHDFIMMNMVGQIPIFFVRYEDLLCNPGPILTDVFKFVLNVTSLVGTVLERRIK